MKNNKITLLVNGGVQEPCEASPLSLVCLIADGWKLYNYTEGKRESSCSFEEADKQLRQEINET